VAYHRETEFWSQMTCCFSQGWHYCIQSCAIYRLQCILNCIAFLTDYTVGKTCTNSDQCSTNMVCETRTDDGVMKCREYITLVLLSSCSAFFFFQEGINRKPLSCQPSVLLSTVMFHHLKKL
jgi:hypothetical protein